ncbi:MAG: hypothetical protein HQK51_15610, partial [Oligoflexia bacterium]|nr:hypothetical protein [Oligoflexia bacterium]
MNNFTIRKGQRGDENLLHSIENDLYGEEESTSLEIFKDILYDRENYHNYYLDVIE